MQIIEYDWKNYVYIIQLIILLKYGSNLFTLARYNKNKMLTDTIWNIINPIGIFRRTNFIYAILSISNMKLANSALFLLN